MNVIKGLETIKSLQQQFSSQIQVIPGGSINSQNVREILDSTKVTNIHCSASKKILRDSCSTAFAATALEIKISQTDEIVTIKHKLIN